MSDEKGLAALAQPITLELSGKVILNRVYRSPVSEYAAAYDKNDIAKTGRPSEQYEKLYQELADGGVGMICFGNITVDRDHLEDVGNACIDRRNNWDAVEAFKPAIQAAKSKGSICLPQLQFPGRQVPAFLNPHPMSPSDVQLEPSMQKTYGKPIPMSRDDIKDLIKKFVWAAEILVRAGADGIMLHGCHGYVINQFLSPHTNRRNDEYGGVLRNRARFVLELVHAIKARISIEKYVIAIKLNCHDFLEGGQTFAEQCVLMKWLEDAGVDFFDISGGTYSTPAWRGNIMPELTDRPIQQEYGSYFLEWAQDMKRILSHAVIGTTGGWRDPSRMAEAVSNGKVDMCGLARPLRQDPMIAKKILEGNAEYFN